ncbi:hypothetical protein DES53_102268 [Roseimicrobium gellanilyticum]|uniref:Uncharacterized protein n=1 Tax=Roseimicrobium gellanilyticum TaxID=748857 RepID=A0A366HSH8_9BACT|nr:hypothetical protein DES53_102268 [Roseimicrobium gellanilyticum]
MSGMNQARRDGNHEAAAQTQDTVSQDDGLCNGRLPGSQPQPHSRQASQTDMSQCFSTIDTPYGNNRNYLDYFYQPCFKLAVRSSKTVLPSQKSLHGIFSSIASLR